jgi:hypothetical protein
MFPLVAIGVIDTVANLPPVSLNCYWWQFADGVVDTGGAP